MGPLGSYQLKLVDSTPFGRVQSVQLAITQEISFTIYLHLCLQTLTCTSL